MNIKLVLSYDGTTYNGFQSQENKNTIEDYLKKAICTILKTDTIKVYTAGRTDSGVHALGQIVNFFAENSMREKNWILGLNSLLPSDIKVIDCQFVDDNFNARRSALYREYLYKIANSKYISALDNRYYTHIYSTKLDTDKLNQYTQYLIGEMDFTSFCSANDTNKTKIRSIFYANFSDIGDNKIVFKIIGNAFLQHMVRIIIGTIIELYKNNESPIKIKEIIESKNRQLAGVTFSPKGLVLKKIYYQDVLGFLI